jgi:hypothetical protein
VFLWLAQPTTNLRKYPECAFILHENACVLREIKQVLPSSNPKSQTQTSSGIIQSEIFGRKFLSMP